MAKKNGVRSAAEVRGDLERKGVSISAWAKQHGFDRGLVHAVLNGRVSGRIGASHKVAVLLGMKNGEIVS